MSWQIDPAHSEILFSARHMMISKVRGQFESFSGSVNFDPENMTATTVEVTIDASSINTRNEQRDGHLMSPDFLDAGNFPQLSFKSTSVDQLSDTTGKLHGDLTIRGVTKPVTLDVEYAGTALSPWGTTSAGFSAAVKINRKDWGLTWNQALETGGLLVGEEISIAIELELMKQPEAAPAD
ncbi:MAG: YceI family protein [Ardenticatenaceae bacterium]|nr:YceI family protein [Ardenticatenaceae bacterium]